MTSFLRSLFLAFWVGMTSGIAAAQEPARILAVGDSLMAWRLMTGKSIADVVGDELNEPTASRAVSAARMIFNVPGFAQMGMQIPNQFSGDNWDWVLMNGGGNDLWFGCGCKACDIKLDKLLNPDTGKGAIPDLITSARLTGAKVVWVGYLRSPGVDSLIEECRDEGDALEARITEYVAGRDGVYFVSNADLVPHGDLSFHSVDRIHPSVKASRAIGERVADVIRKNDKDRYT